MGSLTAQHHDANLQLSFYTADLGDRGQVHRDLMTYDISILRYSI